MKRSTDRVLTTHAGSLPRPVPLAELHVSRQEGEAVDDSRFEELVRSSVDEAVARQVGKGVDVVSDGEMSKIGFFDYTTERIGGFSGVISLDGAFAWQDLEAVPEIVAATFQNTHLKIPLCSGPLGYTGHDKVRRDIKNLKSALERHPAVDAFLPAASPGVVAMYCPNRHYKTYDDYVFAIADALHEEYKAITDAGLNLQVDAPDTAVVNNFQTWMRPEVEARGVQRIINLHIEAAKHALRGIPGDKVRFHLCWGNYLGPHTHDYPLRPILEAVFEIDADAISFEAANPAHAHEWELFQELKLPEGKILVPGVIDNKSNVVENPRVVAHRILRFAELVGQENVIASTDCGFCTLVGLGAVHPEVAWMKLGSLAEGATIASQALSKSKGNRLAR